MASPRARIALAPPRPQPDDRSHYRDPLPGPIPSAALPLNTRAAVRRLLVARPPRCGRPILPAWIGHVSSLCHCRAPPSSVSLLGDDTSALTRLSFPRADHGHHDLGRQRDGGWASWAWCWASATARRRRPLGHVAAPSGNSLVAASLRGLGRPRLDRRCRSGRHRENPPLTRRLYCGRCSAADLKRDDRVSLPELATPP